MKKLSTIFRVLLDIQIISAIIWAAAILFSSYFSGKEEITLFLITAAGFHVILMSRLTKTKYTNESKIV